MAVSLTVISIFIIAFLSVFFPKKSKTVIASEIAYIKIDSARIASDNLLKDLLIQYNKNNITGNDLLLKLNNHIPINESLITQSAILKKKYHQSLTNDKIFGFRNIKIFLGHIAMPYVSVSLSLYLLFLFLKEENIFFRKVTFFFSLVGLVSGLFYLIWVFYPSPDIPEWAYIFMLFVFSIFGTLIVNIIGRYIYKLSHINLVIKINNLLNYITFDIKQKYIDKQDRQEYISDYLGQIEKLSKNEKVQTSKENFKK